MSDFFFLLASLTLELFRKCLGIVFCLKRPTFSCIFSPTLHSLLPVPIVSPLGSCEALINVMKAPPGVFILTGWDGEE